MSSDSESSEGTGAYNTSIGGFDATAGIGNGTKTKQDTTRPQNPADRKAKVVKTVKANQAQNGGNKKHQKGFNKQQEESYEMYSKNYKKVPCEFYKKGQCKNGDDCTYRHDVELKTLDTLCKFFLTDSCHNPKCLYLHDKSQYPCKFLHISGKCDKMAECIFSHERFKTKQQIKEFILSNLDGLRSHRDIGMMTPLVLYAIEMKFIKRSREEENQTLSLVPTELYSGDNIDPTEGGGQIGGDFAVGVDLGFHRFPGSNSGHDGEPEIQHWEPQVMVQEPITSSDSRLEDVPASNSQPGPQKRKVRAVFQQKGKTAVSTNTAEVLFMP